jgi:hypothetical protein
MKESTLTSTNFLALLIGKNCERLTLLQFSKIMPHNNQASQ